MSNFHIFVRVDGEPGLRLLMRDLSENDVIRRVVKPYRHGTSIVDGGAIISVSALRELRICCTSAVFEGAYSDAHKAHGKHLDELNRDGGLIFVSAGPSHEDMADEWDDVTEKFLKGREPGSASRPSVITAVTGNPIISTVVGGLLLAGVVYVLGWK